MPNWKKLIVSGSNAVLNSVTASNGFFGTASYATNALTASFASNGGVTQITAGTNITISPTNGKGNVTINSTGGGTPGGGNYNIQYNSGSTFDGTNQFIYDYTSNRVNYNNSIDPYSNPLTNANNHTIELFNSANSISVDSVPYQFTTAQFPYCKYITANATDKIISFDTNAGTGLGPGLKMHSFKCDYTLSSLNTLDVMVDTGKVGTLYCTWDEDRATYNPTLSDTFTASSGSSVSKLDDSIFTADWNSAFVELSLDLTAVNAVNVIFNGVFTIFSMKPV